MSARSESEDLFEEAVVYVTAPAGLDFAVLLRFRVHVEKILAGDLLPYDGEVWVDLVLQDSEIEARGTALKVIDASPGTNVLVAFGDNGGAGVETFGAIHEDETEAQGLIDGAQELVGLIRELFGPGGSLLEEAGEQEFPRSIEFNFERGKATFAAFGDGSSLYRMHFKDGKVLHMSVETAVEPQMLDVYVDPGDASAEEIAELYSAFADLHRAFGGEGLELVPGDVDIFEAEVA